MQHSGSDSGVFIFCHFEDSLPEFIDVLLDGTWAKLLACFQPDITVFMVGVLQDLIDILGLTTNIHEFFLAKFVAVLILTLLVLLLWHFHSILFIKQIQFVLL
jgi:hypothetical protein